MSNIVVIMCTLANILMTMNMEDKTITVAKINGLKHFKLKPKPVMDHLYIMVDSQPEAAVDHLHFMIYQRLTNTLLMKEYMVIMEMHHMFKNREYLMGKEHFLKIHGRLDISKLDNHKFQGNQFNQIQRLYKITQRSRNIKRNHRFHLQNQGGDRSMRNSQAWAQNIIQSIMNMNQIIIEYLNLYTGVMKKYYNKIAQVAHIIPKELNR